MKFKIIHLDSARESITCDLSELSYYLVPNCEILRFFDDGTLEAIGFVSQETLVGFVIDFAQYALDNHCPKDKVDSRLTEGLIIARRYLKKQASLQEVKAAAHAAFDIYHSYPRIRNSAYAAAANSATNAIYAIYANNNNIANAVIGASDSARNKLKERNRQGNYILSFFKEESDSVAQLTASSLTLPTGSVILEE